MDIFKRIISILIAFFITVVLIDDVNQFYEDKDLNFFKFLCYLIYTTIFVLLCKAYIRILK